MDLVIKNAKIVTMEDPDSYAEALAVKDGRIVKVGNYDEMKSDCTGKTRIMDLKGRLLIPGFNDSHMHLLSYGLSLKRVNLTGALSIGEIILRIQKFIKDNNVAAGRWVQGTGWNQDYFNEKVFPNRYDLDNASREHPICIIRACYHIAIVNSKALEILKINKNTSQIEGGQFDVDDKGEPLGIFRENAVRLIYDLIPEPGLEEIKGIIRDALAIASSKGITSIQTDDFEHLPSKDYNKIINAYRELHNEGGLKVRINEQCLLPDLERLEGFLNSGNMTGKGDSFFRIGPLKLLTDGSLGARTALLRDTYTDDEHTRGISVYSQEKLDEIVLKAHRQGMQIAIHCIGDKAMDMAFKSYEKAQKEYPRENLRHSIIHCQITDEALIEKFCKQNIIAHIQPIFLNYDMHIAENRLGWKRVKTSYNWKSLLNKGVRLAIGTDCPVEDIDPLPNIYCAVTRKDLSGYPDNGWMPEQKLTVYEALHGYTKGAAYASFEDKVKGSISIGKYADFAVLSEDIFSIEPERIKDVKVIMTIVNGEVVFIDNEEIHLNLQNLPDIGL